MAEPKKTSQLLWFVALYLGGISALTVLAGMLKAAMGLL
tara:strand:- start:658 stop:774 length:117 start_codon:yes stop_codon:yes gene_type:complete